MEDGGDVQSGQNPTNERPFLLLVAELPFSALKPSRPEEIKWLATTLGEDGNIKYLCVFLLIGPCGLLNLKDGVAVACSPARSPLSTS